MLLHIQPTDTKRLPQREAHWINACPAWAAVIERKRLGGEELRIVSSKARIHAL